MVWYGMLWHESDASALQNLGQGATSRAHLYLFMRGSPDELTTFCDNLRYPVDRYVYILQEWDGKMMVNDG